MTADAIRRLRTHLPPELLDGLAVVDVGSGGAVGMVGDLIVELRTGGAVGTRPIGGGMFEELGYERGAIVSRRVFRADGIEGGLSPREREERTFRGKGRKRSGPPGAAAARFRVHHDEEDDADSTR